MTIGIKGLDAKIEGEEKVGSTLTVVSENIDLEQCDFQWNRGCIKYSHTPNYDDDGTRNGFYPNSYTNTEVVTIEGAESLPVLIKYDTEQTYDWVKIFEGNHPEYDINTEGHLYKLHGEGEKEITINGDSVTFVFRSDDSGIRSGYYAKVGTSEAIKGAIKKNYIVQENDTYVYCTVIGKGTYFEEKITDALRIMR
jgi:hypothetical protein